MGSLLGHLVPGSMFIVVALWWFIGEILQNRERRHRAGSRTTTKRSSSIPTVWYPCPCPRFSKFPFEPLLKVAMMILGLLGELALTKDYALFDENGEFMDRNIDNYAHSTMYCFFGFSGLVDLVLWYNLMPLPPKFDHFVFSVALSIEGFLFYFHLHGRDELNVRLHTILYLVIFVSAAVFLLAVISDQVFVYMGFLKAYLLSLQGCWFYQIAFVLFGPRPWKNTPGNVEFIAIAFALHVFGLFVVHLIGHVICYRFFISKRPPNRELIDGESSSEEMVLIMHQ